MGIKPRGPSTLPRLPASRIMSGDATRHVEIGPPALHLLDELLGAQHDGAGFFGGVGWSVSLQNATTRTCLPVPWGSRRCRAPSGRRGAGLRPG